MSEDLNPQKKYPKTISSAKLLDANLIQDVYDYILNNLEEPLPNLRDFSHLFGTNEFKLKESFYHYFNTTVYQFYNDERLKKAYLLIQQTNTPLKEIAYISGFNSYINFYKAFKKKYGFTPSEIIRKDKLE